MFHLITSPKFMLTLNLDTVKSKIKNNVVHIY